MYISPSAERMIKTTTASMNRFLLNFDCVSVSCITAFANKEATASVPVKLTVVNDYRSISVTVPASLPVEIYNGTVVTANNARITNNAKRHMNNAPSFMK